MFGYANKGANFEADRAISAIAARRHGIVTHTQLIAAGIQLYVLFIHELPESERVIALLIMALVVVQIWVSRPRAGRG